MSFLGPSSPLLLSPLSQLDVFFLRTSLSNLSDPQCVIPASRREGCQEALEKALRGDGSVLEAAASLMKGHEDNFIRKLQSLASAYGEPLHIVEIVHRSPLKNRLLVPQDWVNCFWIEHLMTKNPEAGDWEVTGVKLSRKDDDPLYIREGKDPAKKILPRELTQLRYLEGLGAFYDSFIHPRGSQIWRYVPLQLILGAMTLQTSEGKGIRMQFTPYPSTADEANGLLAEGARPLCIASKKYLPEGEEPQKAAGGVDDIGALQVHGKVVDGYTMILHEIEHGLLLNNLSPDEQRDMVDLDACLKAVIKRLPENLEGKIFSFLEGVRQEYLGIYARPGAAIDGVRIAESNRQIPRELNFAEQFRRELDRRFDQDHPRRSRILGPYADPGVPLPPLTSGKTPV